MWRTAFPMLACCVLSTACGDKKSPAHEDAQVAIPCPVSGTKVTVRRLADKVMGGAMLVTAPPGDPRLFVVEQRGMIRIYENEQLVATPFLDLTPDHGGPVVAGGELGLLGLAFHPQYAQNGQFFVWYTTPAGSQYADVLARYQVSSDPGRADPKGTVLLSIPDPYSNHNGGMLEFGADGFLYAGSGDGGSAGDPQRNAQNPNALLGKMLRIDVDHKAAGKEYGIPADNPFAAGGGAPEVYMLGLRNPWRWTFDRATGDMWLADVGQDQTEELDVLKAGEQRGKNLGWSAYEGRTCCATQGDRCRQTGAQQACNPAGMTFGVDHRSHASGWRSITGGQVYRGACYPDLVGWYFYTDYEHGGLTRAQLKPDNTLDIVEIPGSFPRGVASIHADAHDELWATDTAGNIYRIEALP